MATAIAWAVVALIVGLLLFVLACLLKVGKYQERELWDAHDAAERERRAQEATDPAQ